MPNQILTNVTNILKGQVGYQEGPRNNETKFGAWFGMNFTAWCAIFQSWGSYFGGTTYFGKPWRFASTIAARDHAKRNQRWTTIPTVGTIAMRAHTSTTGHVGWVIAILNRNGVISIVTLEGNTNDQGAREGNCVAIRERLASSWDGYIILDQTYLQDQPLIDPQEFDMALILSTDAPETLEIGVGLNDGVPPQRLNAQDAGGLSAAGVRTAHVSKALFDRVNSRAEG